MITQIGQHIIRHGDITEATPFFDGKVDFVYSDLPWGNLKYWQTLNFKQTGITRRETNLSVFLDKFFGFIKQVSKPSLVAYIEQGIKLEQK